ncbi:MAG TPA: hypothetical protein VK421_00950 [Pyrinomonadaceae bacterium]|nr:hypothetical protein [Pyrinomonadaceae bacterium]
MRRLSTSITLSFVLTLAAVAATPSNDAARAEETLKQARKAVGGEEKLGAVQSLTAKGKYRRVFGERETAGERELSFQFPDKYLIADSFAVGGLSTAMTTSKGMNGEQAWQGGRGGMIFVGGPEMSEEQRMAMFRRNFQTEWARLALGLLLTTQPSFPVQFTYAGEAEAEDGRADVLDAAGPEKFAARLFLDKQTHLPLMLTYKITARRIAGGPLSIRNGMSKEEIDKMIKEQQEKAGPPQEVEHQIRFSDFRKVGGLTLPHRITHTSDAGDMTEEWEITKYEINPQLKPDTFKKP